MPKVQLTTETINKDEIKSVLRITCKDNTKRIVNVLGRYNQQNATTLARDLENSNFLSVEVDGQ